MLIKQLNVGGIRVINIESPGDNCFFGIGVLSGANKEDPSVAGVAHFAEHMAFKGTTKRNYKEISRHLALLGASPNAWTSGDEVVYHCTFPKDSFVGVTELMMDIFFNSIVPEKEMESERQVILEERRMYDDDHGCFFSSKVHDKLFTWDKGHDELGTFETINSITRQDVNFHVAQKTNLANFVIMVSGNLSDKEVEREIARHIPNGHSYLEEGKQNKVDLGMWSDYARNQKEPLIVERKGITQSSISISFEGLPLKCDYYQPQKVLMNALGGGMFSMLFDRIREELGLCYSVYGSYHFLSYPGCFILGINGLTKPSNVDLFLEEVDKVYKDVLKNGLEEEMFQCAKMSILSRSLAKLETAAGKAVTSLSTYLYGNELQFEDILNKIRNVTKKDCENAAELIFGRPMHIAIMNPKGE